MKKTTYSPPSHAPLHMSTYLFCFVFLSALATPACAQPIHTAATHTADNELKWSATPFGPLASPVKGDFSKEGHISYIKFPEGMVTPMHTHSQSYTGIVIKGETRHWLPEKPGSKKVLSAGAHWSIPADAYHVSECLPGSECIMAIIQNGPMDFTSQAKQYGFSDSQVLGIYLQVNSFDVEVGQLAKEKGHSADVRALGAMVSNDHSSILEQVKDMAEKQGISPQKPTDHEAAKKAHQEVLSTLNRLSGPAFDKAYLTHELQFHENAIQAVREVLLPALENAELSSHLHSVLPGFAHHLSETRRVANKLGI